MRRYSDHQMDSTWYPEPAHDDHRPVGADGPLGRSEEEQIYPS